MNGCGHCIAKCQIHHSYQIFNIFFHSFPDPLKHDSHKTIFIEIGNKFLIVQPAKSMSDGKNIVATDDVGAGIGEIVLVATGSAARVGCGMPDAPVDAAIVGIIDDGADLEI